MAERRRKPATTARPAGERHDPDFLDAMRRLAVRSLDPEPPTPPSSAPHGREVRAAERGETLDPVRPDEQALFASAMASLDQVVDKDQQQAEQQRAARAAQMARPQRSAHPLTAQPTIDDRLDLHRERQAQALERLHAFLVQSSIRGLATVLVVTGKGQHSDDGRGVLRQAVESWLIRHGTPWVARYAEAPRALGGRGAWILTLRR